jgi:hypothetical protein
VQRSSLKNLQVVIVQNFGSAIQLCNEDFYFLRRRRRDEAETHFHALDLADRDGVSVAQNKLSLSLTSGISHDAHGSWDSKQSKVNAARSFTMSHYSGAE